MDLQEYQEKGRLREQINNEIAIPAYRQFCKENELNFHFWDELSEQEFNPKIANDESNLQSKALVLFNHSKSKYDILNDKVVEYYFVGGRLSFSVIDIEEFLIQVETSETKLKNLRFRNQIVEGILGLFTFVLINFLWSNINTGFATLGIFLSLIVIFFSFNKVLGYVGNKFQNKKEKEIKDRISKLRNELKSL